MNAQKKDTIHGKASYYGSSYKRKKKMANGEYYNPNKYTAAMKTYPFGTKVRVKNKENGKTVDVTVTDRGPFAKNRVIDLSVIAAKELGILKCGVAQVEITKL